MKLPHFISTCSAGLKAFCYPRFGCKIARSKMWRRRIRCLQLKINNALATANGKDTFRNSRVLTDMRFSFVASFSEKGVEYALLSSCIIVHNFVIKVCMTASIFCRCCSEFVVSALVKSFLNSARISLTFLSLLDYTMSKFKSVFTCAEYFILSR